MKSAVLAVFAALSGNALAQFPFCQDAGVQIAQQVILALGPLYGTQSCYSLLNVPQTTVSTTVTSTIFSRPATTTTSTLSSGSVVSSAVTTTTVTTTTSTPSATATTTTYTIDGAMRRREPQRDAKNKGGAPATGSAKVSACSCILGPNPTQTISQRFTISSTTTVSTTITSTSTVATTTVTSTSTLTSTSTTTTANGVATSPAVVHFTRVYGPGSGQGYTSGTAVVVNSGTEQGCLQLCAEDATCQVVFAARESGTYLCVKDTTPFNAARLTTDPLVLTGTAYNRGATMSTKKRSPADLFDKRSFITVLKNKLEKVKA